MKLNGWQRIWVILAIAYGCFIVFYAIVNQPKTSNVRGLWIYEASNLMSDKVNQQEDRNISSYQFRDRIIEGRSHEEATDLLLKMAQSPTQSQQIFSEELTLINEKYQKQLKDFPKTKAIYFLTITGFWIAPLIVLYALGWSVGWVIDGFKKTNQR